MKTILLAEDHPLVHEVIKKFLERNGHRVIAATNGPDLITELRRLMESEQGFRPDALFTDINMPGMLGHELAQTVRGMFPEIPVVFMTSTPENVETYGLLKISPFHFIKKNGVGLLQDLGEMLAKALPN